MSEFLTWFSIKDIIILLLVLTLSLVFLVKTTKLKKLIAKQFSLEFGSSQTAQRNYMEHGIFHELYMATNIVECAHKNKKQCFEAFLKIYNEILYQKLLQWVDSVLRTKGETLEEIFKVFTEVEDRCEEKSHGIYVMVFCNNKRYNLKGIPELLIEKFKTKNNPIQLILNEQIKGVLNDVLHNTWQDKLLAILDIVEAQYRVNFRTNSILQTLNGDIDREVEEWVAKNV